MKKIKTIQKEIEIVDDVVCNKCSKSCRPNKEVSDFYGLIEASFATGYESEALPDGVTFTFSLCEECLAEMFKGFSIEPEKEEFF